MRIVINDRTTCTAAAEEVHRCICPLSEQQVRAFDRVLVDGRGHRCRGELTGMAVGAPNDRLQQVRGPFNTPKHAARDACRCQIPPRTTHV